MPIPEEHTPREATITVSASDSLLPDSADFRCDGTADEVQINLAIAALAAGGGKVLLLDGSYDIADEIVLPSNIEFAGQGWSTVLTYSGTDDTIMITADVKDNILIHSMKLDGGNLASHILNIRNVNGFEVHSLYIGNPRQAGGVLYTSGIDTGEQALQHGFIHHNYLDCNSRGQALYATVHAHDITFSDNVIIEPYDNGIDIGGVSAAHPCQRIIFHNNVIYKTQGIGYGVSIRGKSLDINVSDNFIHVTTGHGIGVILATTPYPQDIIIDSNRISGINTGSRDGIYIQAANNAGHIAIRNNQISVAGSGRSGIYIARAFKFDITNNMILDCPDNGIHLTDGQGTVCGNQIYSAGGHGISAGTALDNCSFNNNRIEDPTNDGMYLELTDHCSVVGNVIDNPGSEGINLASTTNCSIVGNVIHAAGSHGIIVTGSDNLISSNVIEACTTRGISASVSNTIISNNRVVDTAGAGIRLYNGTGNVLVGNICLDTRVGGARTQTHGIMEAGTTDDYNIIQGNNLTNNVTADLLVIGLHTIAYSNHNESFMDIQAVTANYVVTAEDISGGGDIVCTLAAQPDVPRNLTLTVTDGNASISAFTITVVGVDAKGNAVTEAWVFGGGLVQTGVVAFATVTSITITDLVGAGVGDTVDVGIGSKLGLANIIYATADVYKATRTTGGAGAATAGDYSGAGNITVNATYHTVDMATGAGIVAGDCYAVSYKHNLNIVT